MESEQLRTLLAVVDEGSFEDAAYALGISPSAVSQRIKALETQLGRTVLIRARPALPTESGAVLMRLARQQELLRADALSELGASDGPNPSLTLVVNADSLATWALPPLARVASEHGVRVEVTREDQDHSTRGLRSGAAMAAVTSVADPVPGCSVRRLGAMPYRPMATRDFCQRWFPDGATVAALAEAPVVVFDRDDDLQHRWLRRRSRRLDPPRHLVPESTSYAWAVRLGMGWGMIPDLQRTPDLVELEPGGVVRVALYWQQWKLRSPVLDALAEAMIEAAADSLTAPPARV
ncbi:ArgP/LysG family DNA-binding transcriptional regulator [Enemella dayhoffiae]|uniref:ArgP/LysG family DNA-binding transcriptional regulator n=1 Tax=Enemella dayhoffiae TaxID=2016507 RepID=A0A255H698_9ACTN|nr:LysR family transcriptional regulator ArgP [Enemella dayhoffiae]OYO23127.1 ArgP/LysG family DNA-binding transcriptional regulator [Enemella dayhoffiae]